MIRSRRVVWYAGLALVVLGVVGLYLSDVISRDWWRGTLQALGVGLLVGGLVDVLVVSYLDLAARKEEQRQEEAARKEEQRQEEVKARVISALTSDDASEGLRRWALHVIESSPELVDSEVEAALKAFVDPPVTWIEHADMHTEPGDKGDGEAP